MDIERRVPHLDNIRIRDIVLVLEDSSSKWIRLKNEFLGATNMNMGLMTLLLKQLDAKTLLTLLRKENNKNC